MKIGLTLNWKAKWHKPLLSPESWQALPQGEAYCNVLTHYFTQWTPKILGYQILKVGALSGQSIPKIRITNPLPRLTT